MEPAYTGDGLDPLQNLAPRPSGYKKECTQPHSIANDQLRCLKWQLVGLVGEHTEMAIFPDMLCTNLLNSKPGHTTGGTGRGGAQRRAARAGGGGARRGAARWSGMAAGGCAQDGGGTMRPGENRPSYPPRHRRHPPWTNLRRHEQKKSHVNRIEEHNERLTTGLSAGRKSALRSWLLANVPTLFCFCKPFHARRAREKGYIQGPVESKTRICRGRVGAVRRTAGRRGGAGPGRTGRLGSVRPGDNRPLCPPGLRGHRRQLS